MHNGFDPKRGVSFGLRRESNGLHRACASSRNEYRRKNHSNAVIGSHQMARHRSLRSRDERHSAGAPPLVRSFERGRLFGDFVMLKRERPRGVRLGIEFEADVLLSVLGAQAYSTAVKRAEEASSEEMARDWSVVAATVARKSGVRSSLLDALFG
jgi:hypothetical protein